MTIHFKITKPLLDQIRGDLSRPHPFAFERVGFLFVKQGTAAFPCDPGHPPLSSDGVAPFLRRWYYRFLSWFALTRHETNETSLRGIGKQLENTLMVLAGSYLPVSDEDYIDDPTVGAKIGSTAIRSAMQHSLDTGMGVMHVHMHEGKGRPGFSSTDRNSMNKLMPSFFNVSPDVPHGALVFNQDCIAGVVWKDKKASLIISRVSVVGYPCEFSGGISHVRAL